MAKQTSDIFIRLGIENLEGIDKLKSAFRELDKTLGVSNTTITTARQRINEYIAGTTRSEQAINGQLAALRGLRSQVDINGRSYQELTSEINQLQGELHGSTDAVDRQREALLRNAGAGKQNAEALQRQITNLERLRQQTRPGSSAFLQLGQDIERATASLGRFRSEVSQAASTVAQMPGSTFEKIGNQVAILQRRMQTLNFTSAEFLRYQERINLVNLVQSTIVGRQQVRANAALYASTQYRQFVGARAERIPLPSTPAGYQQRIGEIQAELENITNLERRRELTVELDGLNRRLAGTITTVVTAEQRAVDAVRARVNAQRELLSQSGFGAFSASISGRSFKAEEQAQTVAAVNAASAAMEEAYVARNEAARAGIRRNTELEVQQIRLLDEEDEKNHQATMQRMADEAAAGTKWFNAQLVLSDKVARRSSVLKNTLGFGGRDLSSFYQGVVDIGVARQRATQQLMGRTPEQAIGDIYKMSTIGLTGTGEGSLDAEQALRQQAIAYSGNSRAVKQAFATYTLGQTPGALYPKTGESSTAYARRVEVSMEQGLTTTLTRFRNFVDVFGEKLRGAGDGYLQSERDLRRAAIRFSGNAPAVIEAFRKAPLGTTATALLPKAKESPEEYVSRLGIGATAETFRLPAIPQFSKSTVRELQAVRQALQDVRLDLDPLGANFEATERRITTSVRRIDRELNKRDAGARRGLGGRQLAQIGGAAISGGIFGGPEGFLGGVIGGAFGGVGGSFAGAAAGAQVGMLRQQLAGTTAYAAEIGKMQIALRGVSGSQANYNQAIQAAARLTNELNIPQREATANITRLGAAVLGAGGTMNDATYAFRAITESIKATGGNAEQVDGALLALTQVFSKGKVSAEELNQIAERLPGTFTLFAKATGKTGPELQKALQQGTVGLNDLMKFLELLRDKNAQNALDMSKASEDAGARMTRAFEAMALEVGKVLQPIGAQFQDAFANFAKQATPGIIEATKSFGGLLKVIMDNGAAIGAIAKLAVEFGIATLAIKAFAAVQGPLKFAFDLMVISMTNMREAVGIAKLEFQGFAAAAKNFAASLAKPLVLTVMIVGADIVIRALNDIEEARKNITRIRTEPSAPERLKRAGGAALTRSELIAIANDVAKESASVNDQLYGLLRKRAEAKATYPGGAAEFEKLMQRAARGDTNVLEFGSNRLALQLKEMEMRVKNTDDYFQLLIKTIPNAPTGRRPAGGGFPSPTSDEDKEKAKRTKATTDAQRTAESLAQQEMRLADAVFDHRQNLERRRYELSKELLDLETKNRLDQMGAIEREAAQALEQRRSRDVEYQERLRDINDQIAKAQRDLLSAQRMATVTGGTPGGRTYSNIGGLQGGRQMLHGIPGYAGYDPAHATPTNIHYHFSGKNPQETLAVATYLQQQGYRISEFGGMGQRVGGHAAGSQHYRNNAFDIGGASLGQTDAQIQTGLKRVHALINAFLSAATPTAGPAGAQGRRNITDIGDVGIAQSTLTAKLQERQLLIDDKVRRAKADDVELTNALTSAFRNQNEELSNTLRTETLRAELQSKGYTSAQIDLEVKLAEALDRRNRTLSEIPLVLSSAPDAIQAVNAKYQEQVDLLNKIYNLNQANANSFGFREGAQRYVESIGTMREATAQLTQNGIKGLEDVLVQLSTTGTANFQAFAASVLEQSARMVMQLLIQKTIMQIIGAINPAASATPSFNPFTDFSTGPSFSPFTDFKMAKGGVFAANGIVPYAMGGIVNRPTLFPFANGGSIGTGLMGEAGPEAIIPLQRGANGKLGVAGGGGTTNIVVNVDASGGTSVSGDEAQAKQLGRVVSAAVQAELAKQKRPGGMLA